MLVLVTTLVGFLVASGGAVDWLRLGWTLIGTALAAFGANALNQCVEVARDARMQRTCARPLPSGKLEQQPAWTFALACGISGPVLLAVTVNELTAWLAGLTLLIYVGLYTPLKSRTPLNTLVGAVVGAIPPMMGWTAATGGVAPGAWILAGILFVWQIPHFLSLAWLYRDDYARGGFRMLPVIDQSGNLTCFVIILYSVLLLPLGLAVAFMGLAGAVYAVGSVLLGVALIVLVWRLERERTRVHARRVFLASVIYLPLLLGLMVADRTAPHDDRAAAVDAKPTAAQPLAAIYRSEKP